MISDSRAKQPVSKIDPNGICRRKISTNSVMWRNAESETMDDAH